MIPVSLLPVPIPAIRRIARSRGFCSKSFPKTHLLTAIPSPMGATGSSRLFSISQSVNTPINRKKRLRRALTARRSRLPVIRAESQLSPLKKTGTIFVCHPAGFAPYRAAYPKSVTKTVIIFCGGIRLIRMTPDKCRMPSQPFFPWPPPYRAAHGIGRSAFSNLPSVSPERMPRSSRAFSPCHQSCPHHLLRGLKQHRLRPPRSIPGQQPGLPHPRIQLIPG